MITIKTNAKELELTGNEIHVNFESGFPFFWLRNDSDSKILMSLSPNIEEGGDGVIYVPSGNSNGTMHGYIAKDFYISGTGKVMVMGTGSAHNPFRNTQKGGEIIGIGLEAKIVSELPETGDKKFLYLVPKAALLSDNVYDEYLWINGKWELIGNTEIDLTDYASQADLTSHTGDKSNPHEVTAKQLHFEPFVDMHRKTIGNLQTAILNWFKSAAGTLSAYRFSGDTDSSFYVDNWNNPSVTDSSTNRSVYTVKLLASAISPSGTEYSTAGTFLITKTASYDADTPLESFIVTYFINEWYMYGRLITENYVSKINPPAAIRVSANLGDVGGKTVGELKEMIYSWWKDVPFGQLGVLVFIGIMSQILWNDDDGIITSSTRYQVTPIGGYSGGDGKFLISSYMNDDIFTFRINGGVFSELKKINLS